MKEYVKKIFKKPKINKFIKKLYLYGIDNQFSDFVNPLQLSKCNELVFKNVLFVGLCIFEIFYQDGNNSKEFINYEHLLNNGLSELPIPRTAIKDFDLQIVTVSLRDLIKEQEYFNGLSVLQLEKCLQKLSVNLDNIMQFNKKFSLPTAICNYIVPQKKINNQLLTDQSNLNIDEVIIVLNKEINKLAKNYENTFVVDIESLAQSFGKMYVGEDFYSHINHSSLHHEVPRSFIKGIWSEIVANYKIMQNIDQIKLVILDLDDTLWKGTAAEIIDEAEFGNIIEGIYLGLVEAILLLKQRGIILAIASQNDLSVIENIWDKIWSNRINLDDFAVIKIDWRSKEIKVAEILKETNIGAEEALFIDNDPIQIAKIKSYIPKIRTLGIDLINDWKRILMWSSTTNRKYLSTESKNKTEAIKSIINRDIEMNNAYDKKEFLENLNLEVIVKEVKKYDERIFELLNKTNQFNMAGKKMLLKEFNSYLQDSKIFEFSSKDKFANYGVIAVVILSKYNTIEQFVMSCRVFGLEIEYIILNYLISKNSLPLKIIYKKTDRNSTAYSFLSSVTEQCNDEYMVLKPIKVPEHIKFTFR